jgi:cobalt-zinc-cadmium efflux system protein
MPHDHHHGHSHGPAVDSDRGRLALALAVIVAFMAVEVAVGIAASSLALLVDALAGVAVNLAATWMLARAGRRSLNVEGAYRHIVTDLIAFLGTAVAGAVVLLTGFTRADGIAALAVAAIMAWAAYGLLRDSGRVLLEAAPRGLEPGPIGRAMASLPAVAEVHDLHVWEVTSGFPALSAHVLVAPGDDCHARRRELERLLAEEFGIEHTTLQVDHEYAHELLAIETEGSRRVEGGAAAGGERGDAVPPAT